MTDESSSTSRVIVDLDDFFEGNERWELLEDLARELPGLRVTLFTIPGRCSVPFLEEIAATPWVSLVPHGWEHRSNYECAGWTRDEMLRYLDRVEPLGLERGFKAPGWQISDGCYEALLERGYWVADQPRNNRRRPAGLRAYVLDGSPEQIHGHINEIGNDKSGNELAALRARILARRGARFGFVKDHAR